MRNGTFYLNNSGTRAVHYVNGVKDTHTFKTESGKEVTRTIIEHRSFGNFGTALISYKGKKIEVFFDQILKD